MSADIKRNWFDSDGSNYAKFRPEYPESLAKALSEVTASKGLALDVGCGTGQLTTLLAGYFESVVGVDPSLEQINNAQPAAGVEYLQAGAEELVSKDGSVDLVTAAQAAHWFDLPRFYAEVKRVSKPEGVVVLVSYGVLTISDPELQRRFLTFYKDEIGPYWPKERKLVDEGYQTIEFPFEEFSIHSPAIEKPMTIDEFLGYVSTWSAVKAAKAAGKQQLLNSFANELFDLWADREILVTWPINIRAGKVFS